MTTTGSPAPLRPPGSAPGGAAFGLAAAALFGASTPVAKLLVPGSGPLTLAGLLYLGAGLGLLAAAPFRRRDAEAPIQRSDLPVLASVIVAGGVVGPLLLVVGLARLSGAAASLLLNLEAPFTIALALLMLRERLSRREALGAAVVIVGAAALTWAPGPVQLDPVGVACIAGACAAWALDNNLSQHLAIRDPVAVVRAKALAAGAFNVALGLVVGERLPTGAHFGLALLTGAFGYGVSIVLHLLAVRSLGAARQAAYFAAAPFVGALVAIPLLHDRLPPIHLAAGALMAAGIAAIVRAHHAHGHAHEPTEHEHAHVHDEHHAHEHAGPVVEPHSHVHRHGTLFHDHPHHPDVHHRHGH
ncbi:MAG TPA: DMT family transporter [Anaeromyxobacter sp.]